MTKLRIPRRIPTFQKLNSVLLKDMDKRKEKAWFLHTQLVAESEAAEVKVSPLRLQWSQLKTWRAQPYSRYKHIYVFLNLFIFYCGCTIFPDGLIWPLSVIQNPEEISKLKRKTTNKREVMKLSVEGEEREFDGGILFVAVHGTTRRSHLSPS